MKKVLAFDFGASSGRAILFTYSGGKITEEEIHRFSNDPVDVNGTFCWDVLRLYHEIKQGILKCREKGFDSIGIDTWGVDFGLLDRDGNLLANPVHYRDARTDGMIEKVDAILPRKEMYDECGLQFMHFNTLYQLYAVKTKQPHLLEIAEHLLFMPDLFAYLLTGKMRAEQSIMSTSQLLDHKTGTWNFPLIEKLGFPKKLFPEMIRSGESYGNLSESLCCELGVKSVPVIAVATHDTASAIAAVPSKEKDFVYISCGTWSLMGTELDRPVINPQSFELSFTNERGLAGSVCMLKNIMGLWIIQECKRQWEKDGKKYSFAGIMKMAEESKSFQAFIDVDDRYFEPPNGMPDRIKAYCERTGQNVPQSDGEIARVVYESLAMKYKKTMWEIERLTGNTYKHIHIIGGGCNAALLCDFTANACGKTVLAGPVEATGAGNAIVQLMYHKEVKDVCAARKVIQNSYEVNTFSPGQTVQAWEVHYKKYLEVISA